MREFELQIYSDVACPWCYIGWKRLKPVLDDEDKLRNEFGFILKPKFLPFLINEGLDEKPVTKKELYDSKFMGGDAADSVRSKISREGAKEGIDFSWREDAKVRQTKPAHRVIEKAYEIGGFPLQSRIAEKLYAAFNEQGVDIGDADELASIAASEPDMFGGSVEEAKRFVKSDEGLYELDKQLKKAHGRGIDQVPTYILDETDAYREAISTADWYKKLEVLSRSYGLAKR